MNDDALVIRQDAPERSGTYVVYLQARQSGESDNVVRLLEYRLEEKKYHNEQLMKVGNGFFVFEPDDTYHCVLWIYGWIGPLHEKFPELPHELAPLNAWKHDKNA